MARTTWSRGRNSAAFLRAVPHLVPLLIFWSGFALGVLNTALGGGNLGLLPLRVMCLAADGAGPRQHGVTARLGGGVALRHGHRHGGGGARPSPDFMTSVLPRSVASRAFALCVLSLLAAACDDPTGSVPSAAVGTYALLGGRTHCRGGARLRYGRAHA